MKTVKLRQKEDRRILRGHPWVFSNELERAATAFEAGEIVDVLDSSGRFIGRGYINPRSLIAVRILTRRLEDVDREFLKKKIAAAHALRKRLGFGESFRALFSVKATDFRV
jgi:23S rRNA (cytosine1962-C5)-methyltransferase